MQHIKNCTDFKLKNTAITIGKFDGLHKGHRKLFAQLLRAKADGLTTVVFTFNKAPKNIIYYDEVKNIFTSEEKNRLYENIGIDILIEYPFNQSFINMSSDEFLEDILINQLGMKLIITGTDFKFGKNRSGNIDLLKQKANEYGYKVVIIEKAQYEYKDISSTFIKQLLLEGKIETVNYLLGFPYTVIGTIVLGNQLGRTVGMPTINIIPEDTKLLPPNGVYAVKVWIDNQVYMGITNVGNKPTISDNLQMGIETHILDFEYEVYGKTAIIEFYHFIRPEKKFSSLQEVKNQVDKDIEKCKDILVKN